MLPIHVIKVQINVSRNRFYVTPPHTHTWTLPLYSETVQYFIKPKGIITLIDIVSVSYTHLDVYKRQVVYRSVR